MQETKWILCPICGEKTRVKIQKTTELRNFLLYCHRCKVEFNINVKNFEVEIIERIERKNKKG